MAIDLRGKVAIVTGGGAGIGRAGALKLAEHGADVVIADIEESRCQEVTERVQELGCNALPMTVDMIETDQIRNMVSKTDAHFGRIDILVNNVGGTRYIPFLEQSERSWRRHTDLNLISLFATISAAAPIMIRGGGGGAIVNISSIEGTRAGPNVAVYSACKSAMESFTRSMALELSEHKIRVNCIAPDHTITPGSRGNRTGPVDPSTWRIPTADEQDKMDRLIPLLREGIDRECGDAIAYLSSDMASYITGVVLPVDGGTAAAMGWHRGSKGQWTQLEGQRPDR